MTSLSHILNKPEYLYRPLQILKRIAYRLNPPKTEREATVRLPWGVIIATTPREALGNSLLSFGVYELVVSEAIWRLTDPGDRCVDAGTNIGYMTSIMAIRCGSKGSAQSFEPHPAIFAKLKENVTRWNQSAMASRIAPIELNPMALGSRRATMRLCEPDGFSTNEGIASLAPEGSGGHPVPVDRLDNLASSASGYGIMKVDVEGAEFEVFEGSEKLLAGKQIRDIVYEDFSPYPSRCAVLLQKHGYTVFRLKKQLRGPQILVPTNPLATSTSLNWEPVNYLATVDPRRAQERMQERGWKCLHA